MELKLLICLLLVRNILCTDSLENLEEHEEDVDFKRLENEFATGNITIDDVTAIPEQDENPTTSSDLVTSEKSSNEMKEFRPSLLLGEIEEFRSTNSNPFNSLQHVNFENYVSLDTNYENGRPRKKSKIKQYDTNDGFEMERLKVQQDSFTPTNVRNQHSDVASFRNPTTMYHDSTVIFERPGFLTTIEEKPYFSYESNSYDKLSPIFGKPSKFQSENNFATSYAELQNYEPLRPPNFETIKRPEVIGYLPSLQESHSTKNQKFPYKFYQGPINIQDTTSELVEGGHEVTSPPKEMRISPWKKIIHLIGTILPLGLLLATLSPNIVQIKNTTQSNIVLSKLREIDLPVEYKRGRIDEEPTVCEERSICKMIMDGSKPKSNLLQNIMWNFVTRMTEETIKKSDLLEVFSAVKKKNCSLINC